MNCPIVKRSSDLQVVDIEVSADLFDVRIVSTSVSGRMSLRTVKPKS